ncbi:MAG: CHAT domain-containing protein [Chloroflexota bacterium]
MPVNSVAYEHVNLKKVEPPTATILADLHENSGIHYWIMKPNDLPSDGGNVSINQLPNLEKFWQDLDRILKISVERDRLCPKELESLWLGMRGLGQDLYERFLPVELKNHASKWPESSVIYIGSNEERIPWELMYDGYGFWGEKFNLARIPKIPERSGYTHADKLIKKEKGKRISKVVNVIGGDLTDSSVERIYRLFCVVDKSIVETKKCQKIYTILQAMETADLIHFTCHGSIKSSPSLQVGGNKNSPVDNLDVLDLYSLGDVSNSVIFANACTSGRSGPLLGVLRNFGWEFYKKGADAYIGTLGLVPTKYAIEFAEQFYKKFLEGSTVGEAMSFAKSNAHRENPFWLLYCLYGNPFTCKLCPIVSKST